MPLTIRMAAIYGGSISPPPKSPAGRGFVIRIDSVRRGN